MEKKTLVNLTRIANRTSHVRATNRDKTIHRIKKDGDPQFLAYENPKNAYKNAQKTSKNFKPSIHIGVNTGTNFAKNITLYVSIGCVRLARYCGKL